MNQQLKYKVLQFCIFMLVMMSGSTMIATQSKAVSIIADSPCDTLYYETLSARAWLEAQREISQNQNIILKPDSVFQYTCFDGLMRELADAGNNMLSETNSYGGPLSSGSFESALNNLVNNSLIQYIGNNFGTSGAGGYNLLGGHTAGMGIYHDPSTVSSGSNSPYTCDIMGRVWQAAKCINFVSNSATDGFLTFGEYASGTLDVRHLPTVMACTPINGNWTGNLATALTSGPWTNDPVDTYLELTQPDDCTGASCTCDGDPVPTGLTVVSQAFPSGYDEKICLQPGCRYVPTGATTGNCQAD